MAGGSLFKADTKGRDKPLFSIVTAVYNGELHRKDNSKCPCPTKL